MGVSLSPTMKGLVLSTSLLSSSPLLLLDAEPRPLLGRGGLTGEVTWSLRTLTLLSPERILGLYWPSPTGGGGARFFFLDLMS